MFKNIFLFSCVVIIYELLQFISIVHILISYQGLRMKTSKIGLSYHCHQITNLCITQKFNYIFNEKPNSDYKLYRILITLHNIYFLPTKISNTFWFKFLSSFLYTS